MFEGKRTLPSGACADASRLGRSKRSKRPPQHGPAVSRRAHMGPVPQSLEYTAPSLNSNNAPNVGFACADEIVDERVVGRACCGGARAGLKCLSSTPTHVNLDAALS